MTNGLVRVIGFILGLVIGGYIFLACVLIILGFICGDMEPAKEWLSILGEIK